MNEIKPEPMSEIQIWNMFGEIPISDDGEGDRLCIRVSNDATPLPEELEKKVDENWQATTAKSPNAKDNKILFLRSPVIVSDGDITVDTNVRGFRYTQAFNRNPEFQELTDALNAYKLLSISTHAHLLTKDGKLLFGTKKNQFNQISGFSGFPNAAEDCIDADGEKRLAIYGTILNRLKGEMGHLTGAIKDMYALGVVYVNTPGLRGLDTDYFIKLDETAEKAAERFQESFQFDKQLHVVDFHPDKVIGFVKDIHAQGKKMSKYALGCEYLVMKTYFGEKEANRLLDAVRSLGITMSTDNETGYFK
jgi:hypothetical protein